MRNAALLLVLLIFLSACSATASPIPTSTFSPPPTAAINQVPSTTPAPSATAMGLLATETSSPPAPAALQVCSPLEDMSIQDLPDIVTNPYDPPRPGQDDGHHGVDLAYYRRGSHTTMLGLGIYAVLDGTVSTVIDDRPPYGNMIIIETPLQDLPPAYLAQLNLPQPTGLIPPSSSLTCPLPTLDPAWDMENRSLYVLYAHMQAPSTLKPGDAVKCGQKIGGVGTSGASVNLHLHLETRVGPGGASFIGMSHYNNQATPQEMRNYCAWRVSGAFQLIDPLSLFGEVSLSTPHPAATPEN